MKRILPAVFFLLLQQGRAAYAACTSPAGVEGTIVYNSTSHVPQYCNNASVWTAMGLAGAGGGGCTSPTGVEGQMMYNSTSNLLQYCDGTTWRAMSGGISGSPATPALLQHTSANTTDATFGSTTTLHSLIVACGLTGSGTSDTSMPTSDTAGNSFLVAVGPTYLGGVGGVECYYAINKAATASDQVTMTGTPGALTNVAIAEFSGIASSSPVDTTNTNTGSSTTPSSGSTNATTNANDLIFGMSESAGNTTAGGRLHLSQFPRRQQ
jgi:hypothetical protein